MGGQPAVGVLPGGAVPVGGQEFPEPFCDSPTAGCRPIEAEQAYWFRKKKAMTPEDDAALVKRGLVVHGEPRPTRFGPMLRVKLTNH